MIINKKTDTIEIYGCSDKISSLNFDGRFYYDKIGLNDFPLYYRTQFWMWLDNPEMGDSVYEYNGMNYNKLFDFIPNECLFGGFTTASFAIDFAIKAGYKRAVLYGILDGDYKEIDDTYLTYKKFSSPIPSKIKKSLLYRWKDVIMSYSDKINLEIPYLSI